ncbi:type II secretion system protein N (GspN) [Serratia fonticola]|uniref:Type II secretion system protein N n=1 Tax=Serratia fonticola TaxID=47917 RepID=A0A542D4D6_SERFO|nr:type II secretion system protein N [Serratia fonticola]TQI80028.1 type II secretion system protein N (GspN) [Serratia fonticola]TQI97946.1 type II secretion system protein N (GspN) [Serratia fonticola]TVZ72441.1 type II secretion system protein N (GspN) [Serratia fonticola]
MSAKAKKAALLLACYLLMLGANAPAQVLQTFMPKEMKAGYFSGSLWQGSVHQLSWRNVVLEQLNWRLTFSSWLPAIRVELQDPQHLQGGGVLRGWRSLQLYDWQLSVPADFVRQQLSLPLPVSAQGRLKLRLQQGELTPRGCQRLEGGMLNWQPALLTTPLGPLELVNVQGQLSCDGKGALRVALKQDSAHLSLSGRGTVGGDGRYQFSGQVRSGPVLPDAMKPLLNQLGRANAQGQIAWQVQGQL